MNKPIQTSPLTVLRRLSPLAFATVLVFGGCQAAAAALPIIGGILKTALNNYGHDEAAAAFASVHKALVKQAVVGADKPAAAPIRIDVQLLQRVVEEDGSGEVRESVVAMPNGHELFHHGGPDEADEFLIYVRPQTECYVYVVSVDSTGWFHQLFPTAAGHRRLAAGQTLILPEDRELTYFPDDISGRETVYFVASHQPRTDLVQALAPFRDRARPAGATGVVGKDPMDDIFLGVATRSVEKSVQVLGSTVDAQQFLSRGGEDLVLTRWFWNR